MATPDSEQLSLFTQPEQAPTIGADPEVVEALDRLRIIQLEDGFSPSTRAELNEAFSLKAFAEEPGGTAKHLAEVAIHQGKYGYEPMRTTASITQDYVNYAQGARTDKTMLLTLAEELQEMNDAHPLSTISRDRLATGLGPFVRYMDLRKLGETKDPTQFPFNPLRRYSKKLPRTYDPYVQVVNTPPEVQARIDDVLRTTRVWEAKRTVQLAITEQTNRHEFWTTRLHEVRTHQTGTPKAIAARALEGFGITP